jgi:hypothetical protein
MMADGNNIVWCVFDALVKCMPGISGERETGTASGRDREGA